jgi:lysozyme family protein
MHPMTIPQLLNVIVATEGGYTNHPSDLGGPTIWGITERVARACGFTKPMHTMSREEAKSIYLKQYIQIPSFDKIHEVSAAVGCEIIDTGVNMGVAMTGLFFQRVLNAMNQQQKHYPDLRVDGDCGPRTATAFKSFMAKRGRDGEVVMLRALNCLQGARYLEISEKREANEDFTFGWFLNRVEL